MSHKGGWISVVFVALPLVCSGAPNPPEYAARVTRIFKSTPLVDGHNNLPWETRERFPGKFSMLDLRAATAAIQCRPRPAPRSG